MAITNNCAAERDIPRTRTTNLIYMITWQEKYRVYGQTAEHSESWTANTPNYENIVCTSNLVLHYVFVSNIRVQTNVSNQTTTRSISGTYRHE